MDRPLLVSISCITYNHAPYIRQCLDGFLMQKTDFAFEILIHDDCSTDGTAEIIKEYESQYPDIIKPLYEEENQWIKGRRGSTVFNFPRAKGKYIAMCEGDDYWTDPLKLQKQVDFLEKHKDYVMTYTDAVVVDKDNKRLLHRTPRRYSGNITRELLENGNFIVTASTCFLNLYKDYEKEFDNLPFKLVMGDKLMWLYYSTIGKIHYFKEKMVAYRVVQESASHSSNKDKLIAFNDNGELITKYFNKRYNIGLSDEAIELKYSISRVRAMAKISREEFKRTWIELVKENKKVLLNIRLDIISFVRIVLNKKI